MPKEKGLLVVISGPSGVGKDAIASRLLADGDCVRVVTATTRPRRGGEEEGKHYRFLTKEEFERKLDAGDLLEYAQVFGHFYGTPLETVQSHLRHGRTALLLIDVQGARQVRAAAVPGLFIFVAPPDAETLRARLRGRAREDEAELVRRFAEAERELQASGEYDHVVVNDDLERAVKEIKTLIAQRHRQDSVAL